MYPVTPSSLDEGCSSFVSTLKESRRSLVELVSLGTAMRGANSFPVGSRMSLSAVPLLPSCRVQLTVAYRNEGNQTRGSGEIARRIAAMREWSEPSVLVAFRSVFVSVNAWGSGGSCGVAVAHRLEAEVRGGCQTGGAAKMRGTSRFVEGRGHSYRSSHRCGPTPRSAVTAARDKPLRVLPRSGTTRYVT